MHARGYGAHGYFELTESLTKITRADVFQRVGEKTPAFVRFSTVAGSKGSGDLARDVRGFAVKIYTKEGNWDLVGNNIPVFFIQDAIKFPDLVHSVKPEPDSDFPQAQSAHDNFWDFISLTPESLHMIMWVMSDRAIPRSFRFMEGFGIHTFRFLDAKDRSTFVKFRWKPKMNNPKTRANYEPNSWGAEGGPRENPDRGFRSFAAEENGPKTRLRPESFADHYSQARQFYISQTPVEQKHIGDAIVFELSKVERPDIRSRTVSHLIHIDGGLAMTVADGLGLDLPKPARAARPVNTKLSPSPALSMLKKPVNSFTGRKLGILAADGADAAVFDALVAAVEKEKGVCEVVAPKICGVILSNGTKVAAKQKIDGGPSVLFDAVAILASKDGAKLLAGDSCAKDFVNDAFAHCKFIGYSSEAALVFEKAGLAKDLDEACIKLATKADAMSFVKACRALRHWERETKIDLDAGA